VTASSGLRGGPVDLTVAIGTRGPVVRQVQSHQAPCACLRLTAFNYNAFDFYAPLRRVRDHLEGQPRDPLSLKGAAELACLEPSYFLAYFRRKVGITFSEWLGLWRVRRAAWLFAVRDQSVDEVALQVGLTRRTLERRFKHHTRQTPRTVQGRAPTRCSTMRGNAARRSLDSNDVTCPAKRLSQKANGLVLQTLRRWGSFEGVGLAADDPTST